MTGSSVQCGPLTPTKREQVGAADRHRGHALHRGAVDELDVDRRAEHERQRAARDEHAEHVDLREPHGGADEEAVVEEVLGDRTSSPVTGSVSMRPVLTPKGLHDALSGSPSAAAVMSAAVQPWSSAYCSQSITGSSGKAETVGRRDVDLERHTPEHRGQAFVLEADSPASSMLARSV